MSSSHPGQAKSFLFYCAVLLVAGSSVVFGLDWTVAPLPPMHETEASVQAAKLAAHLPPPVVRKVKVVTQPSPAQPAARGPQVAAVKPAATPARKVTTPAIMTPEQSATQQPPESEQPKCDIDACAAAYRSFRASDCSWQPYEGPRRFCDKGNPPQEVAAADPNAATDADQQVSDKCDIEACKQAYFTFTPSDCTYRPSNGPRRICTKGTPPKPTQAAIDPAVAAADAANAANKTAAPKTGQAAPTCDIEACKRAFFTFTPGDCTYQPSDGPRRLCTKGTPPPQQPAQTAVDPAVAAANAANAEQEKQDKAKREQARLEQLKQEQIRQEQAKLEQAKQEQLKQEQAKQEQAKQEQLKQEQAYPDQGKADAAASDQAKPKCDIEACKRAFFTFTPSDCTYQPSDGPRRLCTKGTPPKPEAKVEPAAPSPPATSAPPVAAPAAPAAPPAAATEPATATPPAAAAPVVSDKCDVEACKQAYFTFNPADCTYQPSGGPRRLCTKGTPAKPQAAAPSAAPAPKRIAPNHIVPPALVPAGR